MSCQTARLDTDWLIRVTQDIKLVMLIAVLDEHLRLVVCAYMSGHDHHGMVSTLHDLRRNCVWNSVVAIVGDVIRQCLLCVEGEVGGLKPRPPGKLIHGP